MVFTFQRSNHIKIKWYLHLKGQITSRSNGIYVLEAKSY